MCAAAVFVTYFTAAISRLVGEHVVVNFCAWWLPGDESAAVIYFTGCQVQGRVHGYRKEREREKKAYTQLKWLQNKGSVLKKKCIL